MKNNNRNSSPCLARVSILVYIYILKENIFYEVWMVRFIPKLYTILQIKRSI